MLNAIIFIAKNGAEDPAHPQEVGMRADQQGT
jgi:hypothetical protein